MILVFGVAVTALMFFFFKVGLENSGAWLYVCFGLPELLLLLFVFFQVIRLIGRSFLSYVLVSSDGLEYCYWPTYRIRCSWDDVERVGKYRSILGIIVYDVLYLKGGQAAGYRGPVRLRGLLGLGTQNVVPLTGIQGWPDGQFGDDLRRYLPQILTGEAKSEQTKTLSLEH